QQMRCRQLSHLEELTLFIPALSVYDSIINSVNKRNIKKKRMAINHFLFFASLFRKFAIFYSVAPRA
ncbi:MAG: hypothetical protein ONA90_04430, partial [candidate division KSB1 bacterium]|nr:hypothetical protein [candidate division KSB1 bacterium]